MGISWSWCWLLWRDSWCHRWCSPVVWPPVVRGKHAPLELFYMGTRTVMGVTPSCLNHHPWWTLVSTITMKGTFQQMKLREMQIFRSLYLLQDLLSVGIRRWPSQLRIGSNGPSHASLNWVLAEVAIEKPKGLICFEVYLSFNKATGKKPFIYYYEHVWI